MQQNKKLEDWEKCTSEIFWGEIAPCYHTLQIGNETLSIDSLAEFIGAGWLRSYGRSV